MKSPISRRGFIGGAAAAGAYAISPGLVSAAAAAPRAPRPDSTINGVRLGINAPFSFRGAATTAEEVLAAMVDLGLSWVELRGPAIEGYAGMPPAPPGGGGGGGGQQLSEAEQAAQAARQAARREEIKQWRLSQSMDKFWELRRMYEQAGVRIQLTKFPDLAANMSDDEVEYIFEVTKALGGEAITLEPPVSDTKRLGQWAAKHRIMLGYHNHAAVDQPERFARPGSWEQAFFYSPFNGANVDIGHWVAGNKNSPIPFIREYSNRITNLHLKDRTYEGANVAWGEGDTPVAEVLRMMRDERYNFQATIELEHPVPPDSTVMNELAKIVQFVRDALNT